ncbi:hypothetical protein [Pararhodobacter sp.]|uniref:hypothetical protein n=1 Tax=Pararhodobacter sp. TaxID=2127056 RepID=UPI002AFEC5C0|nr:hypothetical protein [Pararhodobacter sp.]
MQPIREAALRFVHADVEENEANLSASDSATLTTAIVILRSDGPVSETAPQQIGRIQELLDTLLAQETLGERGVFDRINDPDLGAIGKVKTVPILWESGACINQIRQHFQKVLIMRDLLLARLDAEDQIAWTKVA